MKNYLILFLLALAAGIPGVVSAQFGRNKPHYENFDFEVHQSPHFELYSYIPDANWRQRFLNDAEEWNRVHQLVLRDTIDFRNPLMIYADHPDFQQTNAISGSISTGTGGVTEAFKNRVVLPVAATNQQTHHVLGHELVHAFQYDMVIRGDSTKLRDLQNLPLWMVEGLAEYLSVGAVDPFTAMWMRDAVMNDDVPTIKQLSSGRYFPYRYGQAFWAFVTGLKGDDIINPYFRVTARVGLERATPMVMGMTLDDLSDLWVGSLKKTYGSYTEGVKEDRNIGKELISSSAGSGKINIAPSVSPNGKYLIYLSERDLFSIDLFLADARTGKVIRKIRSSSGSGHLDDLSYIENSGSWSPDSRQFVYVAVERGDNVLVIADVEKGKNERLLIPDGVPAFHNPAWSPDGKSILIAGQKDGRTDLFLVDVVTGATQRLTDDTYSETHPAWSADGATIYYATDRLGMQTRQRPHGAWRFNLATLDVATGKITDLDVFPGADNLNPVEAPDGRLYFLSNRDGFRNLYRYDLTTDSLEQLTDLVTGISGITHYAPAMSIDRRNNRLVYTYFSQQGYRIHGVLADRLEGTPVDKNAVDLTPATLPRLNKKATLVVDQLLTNMGRETVLSETEVTEVAYAPKFKLDYIAGSAGAGVGTNPIFGTNAGLAGGVQAIASDILGDNQLFGSLLLNGELSDFGGSVGFLNRKHRIQYGLSGGRTPFRSFGQLAPGLEDLDIGDDRTVEVLNAPYLIRRLYQDQLTAFAQLPISTTLRLEASVSGSHYGNRVDQYNRYYDPLTFRPLSLQNQRPERREDLESDGFFLATAGVAVVGDASVNGLTAPIKGSRFRFGVDQYAGRFDFTSVTADYRRYLWFGKGALAVRALHQGRYGGNGDELFPLYVGSPWLLRGLNGNDVFNELTTAGFDFNNLLGSKLFVANAELRIPFTGPKPLALIKSGLLFSDLNVFVDGGMAFTDDFASARPIFTAGVSTRINLFGQIVLEPYFARPLVDGGSWSFGLNFQPGW